MLCQRYLTNKRKRTLGGGARAGGVPAVVACSQRAGRAGQHLDRCSLTALPSCSACLSERQLRREEDRDGDLGPRASTAFGLSPRVSVKGPESTSECWFTV